MASRDDIVSDEEGTGEPGNGGAARAREARQRAQQTQLRTADAMRIVNGVIESMDKVSSDTLSLACLQKEMPDALIANVVRAVQALALLYGATGKDSSKLAFACEQILERINQSNGIARKMDYDPKNTQTATMRRVDYMCMATLLFLV
jgi:hypothetical protein